DGSVWLGLGLMLDRRWCDRVTIEPDCLEDAEALLLVAEEEAGAAVQGYEATDTPVGIQIKRRQTGHWDRTAFANLLLETDRPAGSRGPRRREPALAALPRDPRLR